IPGGGRNPACLSLPLRRNALVCCGEMWWKSDPSFVPLAERALAATPILSHIEAGRDAVVLERRACGAGHTDWYYCRSPGDLAALTTELKPGGLVSFYFDGRIRRTKDRSSVR